MDEFVAGHFPGVATAPISDAGAALRLVWFVASDLASGRAGWRSFHMAKPKAADIAHPVAAAASVLLDWPSGLHAWLASRVDPAPQGAGVRAAFGPVLHRMLTSLRGPSFAPLHAEVHTWLASWDGGRVKPWSLLYAPRSGAHSLTGAEAARRLGVKGVRISRLVASGLMEARETRAGSRVFHLVHASAIDALLARCAAAQTVDEAAASLGVTPGQVERLLHAGLLAPLRNPPGRSPGIYIEPSAILALQATLDAACTKRAARGHGRTLAMLSDRGHASLVPTLRAVLSGQLPLARTDAEDGAPLLVPYVVLATRAHGVDGQSCLTVRGAAAVLHLNVRMIPPLVEAGCLDTVGSSTRSALGRRTITTASVEEFRRRYVTAHGLAAERGTSTREVAHRLAVAGVAPVVARDKIRGLSAVWRRVDCEVPW